MASFRSDVPRERITDDRDESDSECAGRRADVRAGLVPQQAVQPGDRWNQVDTDLVPHALVRNVYSASPTSSKARLRSQ